ncbi:MAG: flavodoxin family protein [Verrucomicrobiales bacterium]|nr:flavodoxin family protein [Verrucomicrobiales bacterium]MCP5527523.1 flavodoxin family protein [Verrucomicrobiales bacterium]
METNLTRRHFISTAGTAALAASAVPGRGAENSEGNLTKIIGVSCSPRKGMTTARSVQAALDAAKAVDARIAVELIDLGGLNIAPWSPNPPADDMAALLPKFRDPAVAGLIIGSPCYFRSLSGLAKCFLERLAPLREPTMALAGKPFGVVTVGAYRNGGQELTIEQIQAILLCFGMIPVGGHAPAFQGATLLSASDSVDGDELGLRTAARLGTKLAETALRMAAG